MRFLIVVVVAALSSTALANGPVEKSVRPRLAVMTPRAEQGVSQGAANLLSEIIAADVGRSERYELMTSADVATLLGFERQKSLLGCPNEGECMAEIAQALGATFLLDTTVGCLGSMRVLSVRLLDSRKGNVVSRETLTVNNEGALVQAAHQLVAKIFNLPLVESRTGNPSKVKPGWFVLGGAGVLAAGGAAMGSVAYSDFQSFKGQPFNDRLGDRAKTQAYVADGLYAGALLTAGIAAIMLISGSDQADSVGTF